MTTAGLGSLLIVKATLADHRQLDSKLHRRINRSIWDAIAWLQMNYTVKRNHPGGQEWHYDYLYGLERALVIAEKRLLGTHDWYVEGANLLLALQKERGLWLPDHGPVPAGKGPTKLPIAGTCFAHLFLKRAAFTPKRPVLDGPVITETARQCRAGRTHLGSRSLRFKPSPGSSSLCAAGTVRRCLNYEAP